MQNYLGLLKFVLEKGTRQKNRTGIDTFFVPTASMVFDLSYGFPIVTTKQINFKAVVAELLGFIRGADSAATFRELGTNIWDANANDPRANAGAWFKSSYRRGPDHLGRIYGKQWRDWRYSHEVASLDQLDLALRKIQNDPTSRRIIVTAWNPGELDQMALPPCHLLYQFLVDQTNGKLHMAMYQRSCDMFVGVPFNISSYALLLELVSFVTGYKPGYLTMFLGDVHIYENHVDQVREQLSREPRALPMLRFSDVIAIDNDWPAIKVLESLESKDIWLEGYDPHPPIKGEMAV